MTEDSYRPVPEEICDLFDDANVAEECRDQCIKSIFRAKRAIYYGREAVKARRKAWDLVYALYPELEKERIQFNTNERGVKILRISAAEQPKEGK